MSGAPTVWRNIQSTTTVGNEKAWMFLQTGGWTGGGRGYGGKVGGGWGQRGRGMGVEGVEGAGSGGRGGGDNINYLVKMITENKVFLFSSAKLDVFVCL